eukprot:TRINITY_DN35725_c0_g1_i2.p4 TRINITY_DN35725_c0_g1~~TRINITY_DN35725_c0_g1_i2.p4  ORF type:complete len:129 (-),score=9.93 TRINITY_DN35725_c0_g1_i2:80-466(-)
MYDKYCIALRGDGAVTNYPLHEYSLSETEVCLYQNIAHEKAAAARKRKKQKEHLTIGVHRKRRKIGHSALSVVDGIFYNNHTETTTSGSNEENLDEFNENNSDCFQQHELKDRGRGRKERTCMGEIFF